MEHGIVSAMKRGQLFSPPKRPQSDSLHRRLTEWKIGGSAQKNKGPRQPASNKSADLLRFHKRSRIVGLPLWAQLQCAGSLPDRLAGVCARSAPPIDRSLRKPVPLADP